MPIFANSSKKTTVNNEPGVRLVDIRANRCRWPLSDDPRDGLNFRFCGARTVSAKSSWCACHDRVAWRSRETRYAARPVFAEAAE